MHIALAQASMHAMEGVVTLVLKGLRDPVRGSATLSKAAREAHYRTCIVLEAKAGVVVDIVPKFSYR